MGTLKKDFKYKVIKNFLSEDERILLKNYTKMFHIHNISDFDLTDASESSDTAKYGDYLMESLMLKKISRVQKESGLQLIPTYSYWRCYTNDSKLKKHTDRMSCEVSVSCQIDNDGVDWPFTVDGKDLLLKNGDGVLYLGIDLEHERAPYKGDYHIQTFLHYVDKDGPHTEYARDKRLLFGGK